MRDMIRASLSVGFVLLQNFTLTPFSTFIDALRLAADEGDRSRPIHCNWSILGSVRKPIGSSCGVQVTPWEGFGDARRFNYIVVVGGLLHRGPQADTETLAFLKSAAKAGVTLVGLCTATFTLIRAGLMKGKRACVSWYHYRELVAEFPEVTPVADQVYVVDGRRITCAGGAGALDLAAWIVERHLGQAVAQKCLHILQVDRARPPHAAQPQPPGTDAVADPRVRRAIDLIEQALAAPPGTAELARRVNLSSRQLERRFRAETGLAPLDYGRRLRLRHGHHLLTRTDRRIGEIAQECGFADASHFSRQYRAAYGMTPSAARADP
jgi:transcriptional regulator GlxA family with amidase domain